MATAKKKTYPQSEVELQLNQHLEEVNKEKDKEHADPKINEFFASSALYCPRKVQWEKNNGVHFEGETLRKFLIGNLIHDYLQQNIFTIDKGYKCEERYVLKHEGIEVRGRIDVEGEKELIEIKSIARLPSEPLEHHIAQLGIYMRVTGKKGKLLYIEKTSGSMREFKVDKKTADIACDKALTNFKSIYEADTMKELAPAKDTWLCRFCKNVECSYNKGK